MSSRGPLSLSLDDRIEVPLRKTLMEKPSLEIQRRIEQLLTEIGQKKIPGVRAVEVLERIGSVEAKKVLETLATGADSANLSREARASLQRLSQAP